MDAVLREWDGEFAVSAYDERTASFRFIAVHSTQLGPAAGGTRMKTYASPAEGLADACRLAWAMTLKMAAAGLPMGGGKSVLAVPGELSPDDRRHLLLEHGETIDSLRGSYWTGPDVNTDSSDMDTLREVTRYAFGASPEHGGSGSGAPDTAVGVYHGIRASVAHAYGSDDLAARRIHVQGVGAVGGLLVEMLHKDGADVVISDVALDRVEHFYDLLGVEVVAPESWAQTECDVYAPCALGATVNQTTIPQLRCRIVAGAANNVLATRQDGERLAEAGILYAPDFVINGGGAIHLIGYETLGWTPTQVDAHLRGIGDTLAEIYRVADQHGISTEAAAEQLAVTRISAAQ